MKITSLCLSIFLLFWTLGVNAHGPVRQKIAESIQIDAPPEVVWEKIKDFGDLSWLPNVRDTKHEGGESKGATRVLTLNDGKVVTEELKKFSAAKMSYSYKITDMSTIGSIFHSGVDEPIKVIPVTDFAATIQVKAKEGGSVVKWKAGFYRGYMNNNPPEELNEATAISIVKGIFRAGLDNLKQVAESNKTAVKVAKKPQPKQETTRVKKADKNIEVDTQYPASNFQPKVIFSNVKAVKKSKVVFDPKYPAAYFQPKVIYP